MNITDELLDKYFKGNCSPEEQQTVTTFLNQINEFPDHLLSKEEWDSVAEADLSQEKTDQLFEQIKSKTLKKNQVKHLLRSIAAAAVIFMAIGIACYQLTKYNSPPKLVLNEKKRNEPKQLIDWKSTVNYAHSSENVILPDGSTVKVYPGAEIRYQVPFVKDKREIYLKGKGYFKVIKDRKHPFVVYANGVATTALGTSFTITVSKRCDLVKVELHNGKVMVANMPSDLQTPLFNTILKPGDVLKVNKFKGTLSVSNRKNNVSEETVTTVDFVQVPLDEVFKKLEKSYKVEIRFKEEEIKGKFFTGTLHLQHSLENILAEITELNKLTTVKSNQGYLIK